MADMEDVEEIVGTREAAAVATESTGVATTDDEMAAMAGDKTAEGTRHLVLRNSTPTPL